MIALTLNEFLQEQGLTKIDFGLMLGYPRKSAGQNINKMAGFIFVETATGWDVYSKRQARSFVLKSTDL